MKLLTYTPPSDSPSDHERALCAQRADASVLCHALLACFHSLLPPMPTSSSFPPAASMMRENDCVASSVVRLSDVQVARLLACVGRDDLSRRLNLPPTTITTTRQHRMEEQQRQPAESRLSDHCSEDQCSGQDVDNGDDKDSSGESETEHDRRDNSTTSAATAAERGDWRLQNEKDRTALLESDSDSEVSNSPAVVGNNTTGNVSGSDRSPRGVRMVLSSVDESTQVSTCDADQPTASNAACAVDTTPPPRQDSPPNVARATGSSDHDDCDEPARRRQRTMTSADSDVSMAADSDATKSDDDVSDRQAVNDDDTSGAGTSVCSALDGRVRACSVRVCRLSSETLHGYGVARRLAALSEARTRSKTPRSKTDQLVDR